jgi:excinuclease ABC subunit A
MGPEGGFRGGEVVAEGTPEQVATVKASYTGHYLAEILANNRTPLKKKAAVK